MARYVFSIIFLGTLVACDLATLHGKFADWYAMRKINAYFDLTGKQREFLEPRIHKHLLWAKTTFLPDFNHKLDELAQRIERGLTPQDIAWVDTVVNDARTRIGDRLTPDAVVFLLSVSETQHKAFASELNQSNKSWEKRLRQSSKEYRENALERYEDRFEEWSGSITKAQTEDLAKNFGIFADIDNAKTFYSGRREAQETFLAAIAPPPNSVRIKTALDGWFKDSGALRTAANKDAYLLRMKIFQNGLLETEKTLSAEQRKHVIAKIRDYQEKIAAFIKTAD
ncbi:MAG: DUF6279 family lipoprotein [Oligoflexales bacterium]